MWSFQGNWRKHDKDVSSQNISMSTVSGHQAVLSACNNLIQVLEVSPSLAILQYGVDLHPQGC